MPTLYEMFLIILLVANPFGCVPIFVSLVKDFDMRTQQKILLRESILGGFLALILLYLGKPFLNAILIQQYAVNLSGGILIFLVAIAMIFPACEKEQKQEKQEPGQKREPFVVPIATPLLSGGGLFAMLMILREKAPLSHVAMALILAWLIIVPISVMSIYLQKIIGKRGLLVLEQIMGMMLTMLAIEIMLGGLREFLKVNYVSLVNFLTFGR